MGQQTFHINFDWNITPRWNCNPIYDQNHYGRDMYQNSATRPFNSRNSNNKFIEKIVFCAEYTSSNDTFLSYMLLILSRMYPFSCLLSLLFFTFYNFFCFSILSATQMMCFSKDFGSLLLLFGSYSFLFCIWLTCLRI